MTRSTVLDREASCERNVWIEGLGRMDPVERATRAQAGMRRWLTAQRLESEECASW
jgi:hypothetical protein